jgi:RTX calcium-binding nonapeptide repeat (4 copies)
VSARPTISAIAAYLSAAVAFAAAPSVASASRDCVSVDGGTRSADRLIGTGDSDRIQGGAGADILDGREDRDCLQGGSGRDLLRGGSGGDLIRAGSGRDRIRTRDGRRDVVRCGPNRDRARIDFKDLVRHCEDVSRHKASPNSPLGGDPTGSPPTGNGPPSGATVQADYVNRACPIDGLWGAVSDAQYYTQSCSAWSDSSDEQVDFSSDGGYPIPALDGHVHPGYRRLGLTEGKQSRYDAGIGNSSYRTQLVSNSDTRTYYPMQPGHRYVWWVSVRFQDPTPLTADGASNDSQVWQIKNTGSCAPSDRVGPIASMTETKNTILLKQRHQDGDVRVDTLPIGPRGAWQMFAFDILYSNDPSKAAYRLWADQDGDSTLDLVALTPKVTGRVTAAGPNCIGKPSIGPYQPMSMPAISRDYGVNQFVEAPVGAPWE